MNKSKEYDRSNIFPAHPSIPVAQAPVAARATFIMRTWLHLLGAIVAFVLMETARFASGAAETVFRFVQGVSRLLISGAFIIVNWLASHVAHRAQSRAAQYAGLTLLVAANAVIFIPVLSAPLSGCAYFEIGDATRHRAGYNRNVSLGARLDGVSPSRKKTVTKPIYGEYRPRKISLRCGGGGKFRR